MLASCSPSSSLAPPSTLSPVPGQEGMDLSSCYKLPRGVLASLEAQLATSW